MKVSRKGFLTAVLQAASAGHDLSGAVALHANFAVLLPATDVGWHLWEVNFLFQEQVHLSLDRVLLAVSDERSAEVDNTHRVEVLVGA